MLNKITCLLIIDFSNWQKSSLVLLFLLISLIFIYYLFQWRTKEIREKQQFENERIRFQFETLNNQLNPHFLFNSFNTLAGIIETNPEKAVIFVERLSDFYREMLNYREKNLIYLSEELRLLENYIFLIEQRFIGKIKFELQIPLDIFNKRVVPLCLQLLVENAIKHNIASRENPLIIKIYKSNNYILVQNKIQLKSAGVESIGIGLENISRRYELLSTEKILILNEMNIFTVKIPLID